MLVSSILKMEAICFSELHCITIQRETVFSVLRGPCRDFIRESVDGTKESREVSN
jgi:hypothetical protein